MAVTISFTADTGTAESTVRQLQANITQAMAGIDAKMQDTARKTGQATEAWRASLQQMSTTMRPAIFGANELGAAFLKTGQAAGATTAQLQKLSGAYGLTGKAAATAATETRQFTQQMANVGGSLRTLASGFGLVLGAQGVATLVKSMVEAGLQMERFERTLTAAVGSARGAQEAFRFITTESNRLGQSVESMVPIFVQLTAATRNTVLEGERTRELFSAMAGAGQAVGLSTDAVAGAMLGLTQIISQNAIQLDEFRNQFASRIPGAMLETAKALKTLGVTQTGTIAEMLKGFERGRISVADLTKAVTMGLQEIQRTAPSMANAVQTAFTQLSNAIFQLSADIARSGLLDLLAKLARFAGRELQGLGRVLNIANVSDVQQLERLNQELAATITLRDEAQRKAADPSRLETAKEILGWTTAKQAVDDYNAAITETRTKIDALTQAVGERQRVDDAKAKADKDRREAEDKALRDADAAAAAGRQGSQDAAARARAGVNLVQERVNQEKIALDQVQALREQAFERDKAMAVESTQQTKAAQADIETAFAIRRLDLARQSALEDARLQEQTAIQIRDTKIAAIHAADSAAQASAAGPNATAEAQVNANKRSAASTVELQTVKLAAENAMQQASKTRMEAEADYEKGLSGIIKGERTDRIKLTEQQLQREAELRQQALQSQSTILSAERELVEAQVEGLVLTREEGQARIQAIEQQALANQRAQLEAAFANEMRLLNERVGAHEDTAGEIAQVQARHAGDLRALDIQVEAQAQRHRNDLLEGWRDWVKDVQGALGNFLFAWADGQINSIKDVLDSLKSYFIRIIADMIAYAATKAIIVPIAGAVLGGLGGGGGSAGILGQVLGLASAATGTGAGTGGSGGLLEAGGLAVTGLGLAKNVYSMLGLDTLMGSLSTGFKTLGESLLTGIDGVFGTAFSATQQASQEAALLLADTTGDLGRGVAGAAGTSGLGTAASVFGGAAAMAGGIYGALNATNNASRAAFAASAAAGTAALASTALVAAGVIAASSGWTGIGLIAAAVTAIIGTVTEMLIKPAGPALAVGQVSGLGIGVQDGRLAVSGDLGSRVLRRDKVDPGMVRGVQAQMEEGLTNAVISIVQTINAVALNPAALLGPTQAALQQAMQNIRPINSANAKKMEQDLTEQLRFVNVQIVAGMLGPLNEAFNQLRDDGSLAQQLDRLPATTQGLVDVFKTMNTQLSEIAGSKNTDVLRQLSGVRNQVENFGNRIAGTAGQIAESIVDQLITSMQATVVPTLAGQISQFAGLMDASFRALGSLRATQQSLEGAGLQGRGVGGQIDRLTATMSLQAERISTEIVSGALRDLAVELDTVLIQPIHVQATTVNSLFNDSLAALQSLWTEWHRLEGEGIDATRVQQQFDRLLGGMMDTVQEITDQAFATESFADFLRVLLSIPEAVANLNPATQQLRQRGVMFAQVAAPVQQVIDTARVDLQSPGERAADTAQRMGELRDAIVQAGDAADRALPLYAQLAQAIQTNAQAQIEAVNAQAEAQTEAINTSAEAHLDWINRVAEADTEAANARAEAEMAVLNAWVDDSTKTWNSWADQMTTELQTWVDASTTMINDLAQAAQTTATQLADVNATLLAEMSPAQQRATLEAQKAQLEAMVNATGSPEALSELINVNQQLLDLAKQSDNLALQKRSLDELRSIQKYLTEQLVAMTGQSDPVLAQIVIAKTQEAWLEYIGLQQKAWTDYIQTTQAAQLEAIALRQETQQAEIAARQEAQLAAIDARREAETAALRLNQETQLAAVASWQEQTVRAIKVDMIAQLEAIQHELRALFGLIDAARHGGLRPAAQQGGLLVSTASLNRQMTGPLTLAAGGMVQAMLEPGERVFQPPMSHAQRGALVAMNQEWPRFSNGGFTVPGAGSGDTVSALVPSGSFILNKRASGALGYQAGGPVSSHGSGAPPLPPIVIDLRGSQFGNVSDAHKVKQIIERDVIRIVEEYNRKTRVDTRLQ